MDTLPGPPPFFDPDASGGANDWKLPGEKDSAASVDYQALATFRYLIRGFLATSENLARAQGLNPQQHQCLLAIAGRPPGVEPTIGYLAARLMIEHNSAVGLVDRLVAQGLVERRPSEIDRRQVQVHLTTHGAAVLEKLSVGHRDELGFLAPRLVKSLRNIVREQ